MLKWANIKVRLLKYLAKPNVFEIPDRGCKGTSRLWLVYMTIPSFHIFFPIPSFSDKPLLPCRDLCESARNGCEKLLKSFDYSWPSAFECSKFPVKSTSNNVCMSRAASSVQESYEKYRTTTERPLNQGAMDFVCPNPLKAPKDLGYQLR